MSTNPQKQSEIYSMNLKSNRKNGSRLLGMKRRKSNRRRLSRLLHAEQLEGRRLLAANLDFGDAPAIFNATLIENNGARHEINLNSGPRLGANIDSESDGVESANADGDDTTGQDDEDGINFAGGGDITIGQSQNVIVSNTGGEGVVNAWIDFNGDGDWTDPGERIFENRTLVEGNRGLGFNVPVDAVPGTTFARFRVSSANLSSPFGLAFDGEVEDVALTIRVANPTLSLSDAEPVDEGGASVFRLMLSETPSSPLEVQVSTVNGTAVDGQDFTAFNETIILQPAFGIDEPVVSFQIPTLTDSEVEGTENFTVMITSSATITNGTATGTINDVAVVLPVVSISDATDVNEGDNAEFTVSLDQAPTSDVTVAVNTAAGTATSPGDFTAIADQILTFTAAGPLSQTVSVTTINDTDVEDAETFMVGLSNATGATIGDGEGTGTILSEDVANTAPTISDIADQLIDVNSSSGELTFTFGDTETPVGDLVVTAISSNESLVPSDDANLTLTGDSESRTLVVTPLADQTGTATITVSVADTGGLIATDEFTITVNGLPQTLVVDNPTDESDGDFTAGNLSLREAIEISNASSGVADTIEFDPAIVGQTITLDATLGQLEIQDGVTITNSGDDTITIDADGNSRIFLIQDSDATTVTDVFLSGLTLTGGNTSTSTLPDGGAILTRENVFLSNSSIIGNVSTGFGGGIAQFVGASNELPIEISLVDSNVSGNAGADSGGGIFSFNSTVNVTSSSVNDNFVTSIGFAYSSGGGIANQSGTTTITNSTISGNVAQGSVTEPSFGGGVYSFDGTVDISGSTISGNSATTLAGGIGLVAGTLNVRNSTISGNASAGGGGGISIDDTTTTIENSTITGNTAVGSGGGVYVYADDFPGESLTITDSIIAGNTDDGTAPDFVSPADEVGDLTITNSLVGDSSSTSLAESQTADAQGNLIGGEGTNLIDPLLGPLADNGGPTLTHALTDGSPAIDAGDPAAVAGADGVPEFDQRGLSRVVDTIDIGSFEFGAIASVNQQPTFTASAIPEIDVNAGEQTVTGFATFNPGAGEESQAVLAYTVTASDPTQFSVLPAISNDGVLTYTIADDVVGSVEFSATVQDDGGTENGGVDTSESQTFTITVNEAVAANLAPSFTADDPPAITVNAGEQTVIGFATFNPGAGEETQAVLAYTVTASDQTQFSVLPAISNDGVLTYTIADDVVGSVEFSATVQDDGGTENGGVDTSESQTFTITVNEVTQAPVLIVSPAGPGGIADPPPLPGTTAQPTSWAQQRSSLRQLSTELPVAVTTVTAADVVLTNLGVNLSDTATTITLRDDQLTVSGTTLTIDLDADQLSDGRYQLELRSSITGGEDFVIEGSRENGLFVLRGDWNGSGSVTALDFATFRYWFGSESNTAPFAPAYVDTNNSGGVTVLDFAAFRNNFGTGISFPGELASTQLQGEGEGDLDSILPTLLNPLDVNGDGEVTSRDALNVINELRDSSGAEVEWSRYDANEDQTISARDALVIINRLANTETDSAALIVSDLLAARDDAGQAEGELVLTAEELTPANETGPLQGDFLSNQFEPNDLVFATVGETSGEEIGEELENVIELISQSE